jgi:hypothetical protein
VTYGIRPKGSRLGRLWDEVRLLNDVSWCLSYRGWRWTYGSHRLGSRGNHQLAQLCEVSLFVFNVSPGLTYGNLDRRWGTQVRR